MRRTRDDLGTLLAELDAHLVSPERYSRTSVLGRCEGLLVTTVLALVAILGGVLLCEATRDDRGTPTRP